MYVIRFSESVDGFDQKYTLLKVILYIKHSSLVCVHISDNREMNGSNTIV